MGGEKTEKQRTRKVYRVKYIEATFHRKHSVREDGGERNPQNTNDKRRKSIQTEYIRDDEWDNRPQQKIP
jgi:hypothetical protein